MDRLTFAEWFKREYPLYEREGRDTSFKAALRIAWETAESQSLSQEAVRGEALEEAAGVCDELAAKHKKRGEKAAIKSGYSAATTNGHINAGCGALQCADLIRALKREPNAAAQASGSSEHTMVSANPAPAAPDVASMVKRLEMLYNFKLPATGGQILELKGGCRVTAPAESFEVLREAATLLARLGQGWKVTETWRGPMGTCPRCGADHYCKPAPGASDE